jgi:hypothetical protein
MNERNIMAVIHGTYACNNVYVHSGFSREGKIAPSRFGSACRSPIEMGNITQPLQVPFSLLCTGCFPDRPGNFFLLITGGYRSSLWVTEACLQDCRLSRSCLMENIIHVQKKKNFKIKKDGGRIKAYASLGLDNGASLER